MEEKDDFMDLLSLVDDENEEETQTADDYMAKAEDLTEEQIQQITIAEAFRTLEMNNEVISEVKDMVIVSADSEYADAYSKLAKSNADIIKIIADFALQKERLKTQKEIKKMDIEGKKEVNEHKHQLEGKMDTPQIGGGNGTTNVFIGGRDEIFNKLFGEEPEEEKIVPLSQQKAKEAIEVESEETSE